MPSASLSSFVAINFTLTTGIQKITLHFTAARLIIVIVAVLFSFTAGIVIRTTQLN